MTQKHTPLPWKIGSTRADGYNFTTIVNEKKAYIATVDIENETENAAFIVRAVNNHYQLIEALEALVNADSYELDQMAIKGARAAISKAKGESL